MPSPPRTVIAANASYVPTRVVPNSAFLAGTLLDSAGRPFAKPNEEIVAQLEAITGIRERRYVEDHQVTSDIALAASRAALERSGVDPESLDLIIVAHNFGDVAADNRDKLIAMIATWYVEAGKYQVMPIDGSGLARMMGEKPLIALPRDRYTYLPNTQPIPNFAAPKVLNRPHSITADVEIPEQGAEGVLLSQGTAAGGY